MISKTTMKCCSAILTLLLAFGSPTSLAQEMKSQRSKASGASLSLNSEQKVIHLLDRMTFGARPGDVERVLKIGWQKFLDQQLHPERISDEVAEQKLKELESIHLSGREMATTYPRPQVVREVLRSRGLESGAGQAAPNGQGEQDNTAGNKNRRAVVQALAEMGYKPQQRAVQELQQSKILRAVYSEKQLQEVMTDFWFNHFNVYIQKGADRILTTSYERDVIRPHVFGKFEHLLLATAESPAMLFYLDNWLSVSPNANMRASRNRDQEGQMRREYPFGRTPRARIANPDLENSGEMPHEPDNAQMLRKNGKIPKNKSRGVNENYAREIMELHTLGVEGGYTQKDVQEVARCFTGWTIRAPRAGGEFFFNPNMHDDEEKVVLGKKIPAGGGKKDGEIVIHMLATHPSTAKFISTKLARKFVSDNPPQSLITRMAQTFQKTEGNIREVLRAMFTSPEFFAPENYRAKIKTPFEMTVSAVRVTGADTDGNPAFHRWLAQMGEGLFLAQPPTGYPDTSEHWVNAGALLERMNFALALSANRIPGTLINLGSLVPNVDTMPPSMVVDRYARLLLHGELSQQTRATINEQVIAKADGSKSEIDVAKIVGLILGSPDFQRQ
jgi:uncharacterized protein (DUF1800 family)